MVLTTLQNNYLLSPPPPTLPLACQFLARGQGLNLETHEPSLQMQRKAGILGAEYPSPEKVNLRITVDYMTPPPKVEGYLLSYCFAAENNKCAK